MELERLKLVTSHLHLLNTFLEDVLDYETVKSNEEECVAELGKLRIHCRSQKSVKSDDEFEFHLSKEELANIQKKMELFLYTRQEAKGNFEMDFFDLKLKKELQLKIKDPDHRTWYFRA